MARIEKFEDIDAWQDARELVKFVYRDIGDIILFIDRAKGFWQAWAWPELRGW